MSAVLTIVAAVGLFAIGFATALGGLILPTLLNVAVSIWIACMLSRNWGVRLALAAVISLALSINFRIPSVVMDAFTEPKVQSNVSKKVVLGPSEKVRMDSDGEHLYYRRTTEPPRFGIQNDWHFRIGHIPVVKERPVEILKDNGVAVSTSSASQRVVLRVRRHESMGIMRVMVTLEDSGQIVASYEQSVRKAFLLEDFNHHGKFVDDWRPVFLYLTQATPWNLSKEIFPRGYAPLANFLREAIEQRGVLEDGSMVQATSDPVNLMSRSGKSRAKITFEYPRFGHAIPDGQKTCEGNDGEWPFSVTRAGEVIWKDEDFPPLHVQNVPVDGVRPFFSGVMCFGDSFWLGVYHMKRIHLWQYKVSFKERSLKLQKWLRPELPAVVQASVEGWERKFLTLGGVRQGAILVYLRGGSNRDNYLVHGYEVEVIADH